MMLGTGIVMAWILTFFLVEKLGVDRLKLRRTVIASLVGAIIGARALFFIASSPEQFSLATFFRFEEGGLVAYGGFLGGILVSIPMAMKEKLGWWNAADAVAPGLLLATGITRIGCFLFGCDFGQPLDSPISLHYPEWDIASVGPWIFGSAPSYTQEFGKLMDATTPVYTSALWPTQLMMSLKGFTGFALIMLWMPYRRFQGQMMLVFLAWYAVVRFLVEIVRGDKIRGTETLGLPLSTSQFVAVVIVLVVIPLWIYLSRTKRIVA
jgi:phosphatidylglycerol:prolipoprotein diacylglycerol transferase